MVCYCPFRKILYIHNPKVAGLTIEKILMEKYSFKHFTFEGGKDFPFLIDPRGKLGIFRYVLLYSNESKIYDLKSFFKFSFVRNPYNRAISCIKFLDIASKRKGMNFPKRLEEFMMTARSNNYYYIHFSTTQYRHLLDENDQFLFNYIGKFESLHEDLEHVLFNILKLPRKNIKNIHENKSDKSKLNLDIIAISRIVDIINNEDFDFFGYDKISYD